MDSSYGSKSGSYKVSTKINSLPLAEQVLAEIVDSRQGIA